MKWFKHYTDAHTDEKLAILRSKLGLAGVGIWWTLVELVAQNYSPGKPPGRSFSMHETRFKLGFNTQKVKFTLSLLKELRLLNYSFIDEEIIYIEIPKLSKYCDIYSKRKEGKIQQCSNIVQNEFEHCAPPDSHNVSAIDKDIEIIDTSYLCAEQSQGDSSRPGDPKWMDEAGEYNKVFIKYPTKDKSQNFMLRQRRVDWYKVRFEYLNVERELIKAHDWLMNNPRRRKSSRGMLNFLTQWLNRAKPEDTPLQGKLDERGNSYTPATKEMLDGLLGEE